MDYPHEIDLVWLAFDDTGRLAAMTTGGTGPVPAKVLASGDDDVFALEEALLGLPSISAASVHVQAPDPRSFKALSERGLFVYDWTDVHRSLANAGGAYEIVASPSLVLSLSDLPNDLRRLAAPLDRGVHLGAPSLKVS
jgi:hypothetical protein